MQACISTDLLIVTHVISNKIFFTNALQRVALLSPKITEDVTGQTKKK